MKKPPQNYTDERLKQMTEIDWKLVNKIKKSLEDIKHGKISEVKFKRIKR